MSKYATASRNRHDEHWGGPNPATCDDRVWWEVSGMCGGCGSDDCHDGPCGEVASWHTLLVCDRCPDRIAQGLITTPADQGDNAAGGGPHDCPVCGGEPDPTLDEWNDLTKHWYCPAGNDNCGAASRRQGRAMTGNCGFPEGVIHQHADVCYRAGVADGAAGVAARLADCRDVVARIIDPDAFTEAALTYTPGRWGFPSNWGNRRDRAYRRADEIAALTAAPDDARGESS